MVTISKTQEKFIFKISPWHQLWSFKSTISVPIKDIVNAYQDTSELKKWKGIRVGTEIPGIITAGTFSWRSKRNFWDVMKKRNTIIVELQNNIYNKLYIEVKNPQESLVLLNSN